MKRYLLTAIMAIALAATAAAQDFAAKYMEGRKQDPNIMYMQMPKTMITQAMGSKAKDPAMAKVVEKIDAMAMVVAQANADKYAADAKALIEANKASLKLYTTAQKDGIDISVYTKAGAGDNYSEIIGVAKGDGAFFIIDFTGDLNPELVKQVESQAAKIK